MSRRTLGPLTSAFATAAAASFAAVPAGSALPAARPDLPRPDASRGTSRQRGHQARRHSAHAPRSRKVDATLSFEVGPPSTSLPATQTIALLVPKGISDAGARLPACDPEKLQAQGARACPKGSLVGSGEASGYTLGVVEPIKLTLYNGPHATLLSYVVGVDPVSIQIVVQGSVAPSHSSAYGQELAFTIPHGLLEPLPEGQAWLLALHTHLSGAAGWLRSTSCPPHGWAFQARFGFTNGQSITVGASAECV